MTRTGLHAQSVAWRPVPITTVAPTPQPASAAINNPAALVWDGAHPHAIVAATLDPLYRGTSVTRPSSAIASAFDAIVAPVGLTARDARVITLAVLFRLLKYEHLRARAFSNVDASIARRRILVLERDGWILRWHARARRGVKQAYILPTQHAVAEILAQLRDHARSTAPWSGIASTMLPASRRALHLPSGASPKWFLHHAEINSLLSAIISSRRVLWASSWDAPFPSRHGIFVLPQPDYVLIEEGIDGEPRLVFGEHDRGTEHPRSFQSRKIALYSGLARFPEVCSAAFGFKSFEVHVSVCARDPLARLASLLALAERSPTPHIYRFTLAGWLHAAPAAPIWFAAGASPVSRSLRWTDHPSLVRA